ncbi:unnamed protein product, partial [Closterium sp. NIES-53]
TRPGERWWVPWGRCGEQLRRAQGYGDQFRWSFHSEGGHSRGSWLLRRRRRQCHCRGRGCLARCSVVV